mmetsp:Transcript_32120/g.70323  ORF Transcript_32120/g.70323 Transcript_32120/m.70323 type:complete len:235 (+) Transcript_32120:2-706(+)
MHTCKQNKIWTDKRPQPVGHLFREERQLHKVPTRGETLTERQLLLRHPATEFIKQHHTSTILVHVVELVCGLFSRKSETQDFASRHELLEVHAPVVVRLHALEGHPGFMKVQQIPEESTELIFVHKGIATTRRGLVCSHERRLVVQLWELLYDELIDLCQAHLPVPIVVEAPPQSLQQLLVLEHRGEFLLDRLERTPLSITLPGDALARRCRSRSWSSGTRRGGARANVWTPAA